MRAGLSGPASALLVAQMAAAQAAGELYGMYTGSSAGELAVAGLRADAQLLGAIGDLHVLRSTGPDFGWLCACGWTPDPEGADVSTQWGQHVRRGASRSAP